MISPDKQAVKDFKKFVFFRRVAFGIKLALCLAYMAGVWFCIETKVLAITVDATDVSGSVYTEAVLKEIEAAKSEICVAMFAMYVRYGEDESPVNRLVNALSVAKKRGVNVKVYLDRYSPGDKKNKFSNKGNDIAYRMLRDAGVDVYFVRPEIKLHNKLIVIDRETVIDGSTNWTLKAVSENFESAEILRGKEFAEIKLKQMEKIGQKVVTSTADIRDRSLLECVRIKNSFLEDAKFAPRMVTESDEHSFDLYLLFLKDFFENREAIIRLDYIKIATRLGIKVEMEKSKYRQSIRWILDNLKKKYGLIDYTISDDHNLDVKLLDLDEATKEYTTPKSGYFNVPLAYWEYGIDGQLKLREKFAYMVAVYEQEIAKPKLWWRRSLKGLSEKYHIDEWTFSYGLRELKKLDILRVRHSRIKIGIDSYEDREPNEYRLKELVLPEERERTWKVLESELGEKKFKAAREFSEAIDEGNNVEAVRSFVRLIGVYGEENVKKAVTEVAQFGADNPLRNISYIVGVLKGMGKEEGQGLESKITE